MNNANYQSVRRRGRIFPEVQWSEEEKARRIAERNAFHQRCRAIFDPIHAQLMEEHYGWYVAVEPDSGDHFLDADKVKARQKARKAHPTAQTCMFCLNETGACGRI